MKLCSKRVNLGKELKGVRLVRGELSREESERRLGEVRAELKGENERLRDGVLNVIRADYEKLVKDVSGRLPDLVIAVAKRVLSSVTLEREQVEAIVTEALKESGTEGEELEVYLSEGDYKLLMGGEEGVEGRYPDIKFVSDVKLKSGDCLVKSRFGLIDARVDTKLKQIRQDLE